MDKLTKLIILANIAFSSGFFLDSEVCYDSLGCFSSDDPFDNAYGILPDYPRDIQVRCYLWTRKNDIPEVLDYQNISTILNSDFDNNRPTNLLIHGYMSSKDASPVVANLSTAFLKQGDYNIIGVDWSKGAKTSYPTAVANTRVVGAVLANLVNLLKDHVNMKLEDLHVIGHSLGAHISGYVGRRVPGIARITGLDPAGPMFTDTSPVVRLDPSDAKFVDVIHSDGGPLVDAGFGTMEALGHVDFYPNGGASQPGCPPPVSTTVEELLTLDFTTAFDSIFCAHDRAIWYFIESVKSAGCRFESTACNSWTAYQNGTCGGCSSGCQLMGLEAEDTYKQQGKYFLSTNSQEPFCA